MLLHNFFDDTARRLPTRSRWSATASAIPTPTSRRACEPTGCGCCSARGVERGDRVALFLDNSVEMVVGIYAALRIGAVFMPINSLTKQDKLAYLLNDSRASALDHARGAARDLAARAGRTTQRSTLVSSSGLPPALTH